MFIEYEKGLFIKADAIDWIQIKEDAMIFAISSDAGSEFRVSKELQESFINDLHSIDGGGMTVAYYALASKRE